jgi:uncharacterized protein YlxW (UPF0749 family)
MNVFTSGSRHQPWVWQVTILCFILGVLLAGSLQTVSNIRRAGTSTGRIGQPIRTDTSIAETVRKQASRITELQENNTKLENTLAQGDGQAKALNDELQKTKLTAGLTEVSGPGIYLTLQDSKTGPPSNRQFEIDNYIIHDVTLQRAINELNIAGAEAISINGQRLIGRTGIRCVGNTAQVNGVPFASPFVIRAIGDPDTLAGGLKFPGGFMEWLQSYDPSMARIEIKKNVIVPAYSGSNDFRFAKPHSKEDRSEKTDKAVTVKPVKEQGAS